ncbi:MAG: hypothetical protein HOF71_07020 [Chloroflexi bacterium]|nr:hypothetical protein [Chloroflexota bacterium]
MPASSPDAFSVTRPCEKTRTLAVSVRIHCVSSSFSVDARGTSTLVIILRTSSEVSCHIRLAISSASAQGWPIGASAAACALS